MSPTSNADDSTHEGWDGTFNGQMLPSDDYWFTVTYTDEQGQSVEYRSHFAMKR
jgi:large repetitive protein